MIVCQWSLTIGLLAQWLDATQENWSDSVLELMLPGVAQRAYKMSGFVL